MFHNLFRRTSLLKPILKDPHKAIRITIRNLNSDSAAYDGDGKTTVKVLGQEDEHLHIVATYSARGFRLANNLFITGSILLFPTQVFSWNVKRGIDINMESLLVFDLIVPKIKMLVIGYGQLGESYDPKIVSELRRKGISCELLPTKHAVTTFNYLVHDSVHVAGAFVPVREDVVMTKRDFTELYEYDYKFSDKEYVPRIPDTKKEFEYMRDRAQEIKKKDKGKTSLDD